MQHQWQSELAQPFLIYVHKKINRESHRKGGFATFFLFHEKCVVETPVSLNELFLNEPVRKKISYFIFITLPWHFGFLHLGFGSDFGSGFRSGSSFGSPFASASAFFGSGAVDEFKLTTTHSPFTIK
jgi:hypothetical protein